MTMQSIPENRLKPEVSSRALLVQPNQGIAGKVWRKFPEKEGIQRQTACTCARPKSREKTTLDGSGGGGCPRCYRLDALLPLLRSRAVDAPALQPHNGERESITTAGKSRTGPTSEPAKWLPRREAFTAHRHSENRVASSFSPFFEIGSQSGRRRR